jgi:hypothetical protein
MTFETKSNLRIFLDQLYFSVCFVLVGFLLVSRSTRCMGYGFDLDDNIMVCVVVLAGLSLIFSYLSYVSVYKVISEPIRSTGAYFKSACSQRFYKPGQGIMNVSLVVLKTQLEPTDLSIL